MHPLRTFRWAILSLTIACSGATDPSGPPGDEGPGTLVPARVVAFVGVDVVPMDEPGVLTDQTVVVREGVIEALGRRSTVPVPDDAMVIDGEGRFLMPGLVDMHAHVNSADAPAYLAHGITTVRNMWGFEALPGLVARVEAGELEGPRIRSLSPGIDGPPTRWPQTQLITDPVRADSLVQVQQDRGYRTLKIYSDLSLAVYDSVVAAARRRDMTFAGHVPFAVSIEHALRSGQKSVEHLLGYRTRPREEWPALAALTVETGAWISPTLAILHRAGSGGSDLRAELVKTLHDAGVPILVGTDSGIEITSPGSSIHEELGLLVAAGLTPYEALLGATREAARYFEEDDMWGTVRPGMGADLLLLGANPLEDVGATARHEGVLRGDVWVPLVAH